MKKKSVEGVVYCNACKHVGTYSGDFGETRYQCDHPSNVSERQLSTNPVTGPGNKYRVHVLTPYQKNSNCNCKDFESIE